MANINNIKIGNGTPSKIMLGDPIITTHTNIFDNYKYVNDAGGYWVRGLWLAPAPDNYIYWWPWDLGVPNGALKGNTIDGEVNPGWNKWGFISDGYNKNITYGMTKQFNKGSFTKWDIAITFWFNTPNYTDESGKKFLDLGNRPIKITFLDGRFDDYTWVKATGAIAEWSTDKRTCTIYRIPYESHTVFRSNNTDKTYDKCTTDLRNVYVDLTGISYHTDNYSLIEPASEECWDVFVGNDHIYHKDKTFENCLKEYGFTSNQIDDFWGNLLTLPEGSYCIKNPYSDKKVIFPIITDIENYLSDYKIRFRCKPFNLDFWDNIKEWFANNPIDVTFFDKYSPFANSNINGTLKLIITNTNYITTDAIKAFYNTDILNLDLDIRDYAFTSANKLFQNMKNLRTIKHTGLPLAAKDCSGLFEFCGNLTSYDSTLINWGNKGGHALNSITGTNLGYTFEYTGLIEIPSYDNNRFSDYNTIRPYFFEQAFNGSNKLTTIGPVIDLVLMEPSKSKMSFNCESLIDARIKRLSNGNWNLDGVTRNGVYNGNLPNLNQESVSYLFANLMDLTTSNPSKTVKTITNCFSSDVGWQVDKLVANLYNITTFAFTKSNLPAVYTSNTFENLKIKVSGLSEGDRIEFGSGVIEESENSIKTNGEYTLNKTTTTSEGFQLYRTTGQTPVHINIVNPVDDTIPKVSSANLYCPATWGTLETTVAPTLTIDTTKCSIKNNTITCLKSQPQTDANALAYNTAIGPKHFTIEVSGLNGETLGVGSGPFDTIPNKFTEDGIYTLESSMVGFKLWNDTSEIADANVTIKVTEFNNVQAEIIPSKITDDMVRAANTKGWSIYIGGTVKIVS